MSEVNSTPPLTSDDGFQIHVHRECFDGPRRPHSQTFYHVLRGGEFVCSKKRRVDAEGVVRRMREKEGRGK